MLLWVYRKTYKIVMTVSVIIATFRMTIFIAHGNHRHSLQRHILDPVQWISVCNNWHRWKTQSLLKYRRTNSDFTKELWRHRQHYVVQQVRLLKNINENRTCETIRATKKFRSCRCRNRWTYVHTSSPSYHRWHSHGRCYIIGKSITRKESSETGN